MISPILYLYAVLSVVGVFVICSIIDMARIKFAEVPFFITMTKYTASFLII